MQGTPAEVREQRSILETLRAAEAVGHAAHGRTVTAFTDAMASGLRGTAVVVLVGAVLVARSYGTPRRGAASDNADTVPA